MARTYKRRGRGRNRRGGLLVKEANVQRGVAATGFYPRPMFLHVSDEDQFPTFKIEKSVTMKAMTGSPSDIIDLSSQTKLRISNGSNTDIEIPDYAIRLSSIVVSALQPFRIKARTQTGFVYYNIPGGKPTKVTFGQSTYIGNATLLKTKDMPYSYSYGKTDRFISLLEFEGVAQYSDVDVTLNWVCDSTN